MKALFAELKRRNVIRIALFYGAGAWLILQIADVVLEVLDAPEGSLRLIAIVLALGFPFALILAWAFEITPEGIKRDHEVQRDDAAQVRAGRKLDVATMVLLVIAIGLLAWQGIAGRDAPLRPPAIAGALDLSIAVLPFVNMSPDPDNEYFSEGLSEELLNVLARMEDFRVAGRTSSFAFKGQQQDLRAIGERLGVANILEGSVRRQGDNIRVTAQLIDARSGYHLWSDTYDRRLDDVFAIQDEIATEVVKALRQTLLATDEAVIGRTVTGDVEAYHHYLRGQYLVRLRTRTGLERALEEFQQAIVVDPSYAPPYAGVAMVYALLDNYGYRSLAETAPLANRSLDRALALDPNSDEAWMVRGLLLSQGPGASQRKAESRAALERALEINPNNAMAHLWLTSQLHPDVEAMRASLQRAYELDPLSPVIVHRRAHEALEFRDFDAYERYQAELEEIAPDWFITWQTASRAAQEQGRVADAALALERAVALNPEYAPAALQLSMQLAMLGEDGRAQALLDEAYARVGGEHFRFAIAMNSARRALLERGPAEAADIMAAAVDAGSTPEPQVLADVAILEFNAGRDDVAEARARGLLGIGPDEVPGRVGQLDLSAHLTLLGLHAERGETEAAARIARGIRAMLDELREQGIVLSFMPLTDGVLAMVAGDQSDLEVSLRESIDLGLRWPAGNLTWFLARLVGEQEVARLEAMMAEALAGERERYAAARAASPPPGPPTPR